MNIAFYCNEMNLRGVANSTYLFALYNKKLLLNDYFEKAISDLPDKNLPLYENIISNKDNLIKNLIKILE